MSVKQIGSRPRGYKTFVMLYSTEHGISMLKNKDFSCFQMLRCCIYHAQKYENANNCWHFNIYARINFMISEVE